MKGEATTGVIVALVLGLLIIGVGAYLIFGSAAKTNAGINAFTGCGEGFITDRLYEGSSCFQTQECGTAPEGQSWEFIWKFGCNDTHQYCCGLKEGASETLPACDTKTHCCNEEGPCSGVEIGSYVTVELSGGANPLTSCEVCYVTHPDAERTNCDHRQVDFADRNKCE